MYLVGGPHPNRSILAEFLRSNSGELYVTSAEVYQEVIHRYVAIDRREAIQDCFSFLDRFVEQVHSITRADVEAAKELAGSHHTLSGRDCLHLAVMKRHGLSRILTFDQSFLPLSGIECLPRR
jgi:predicted nucleic acid-binding protein